MVLILMQLLDCTQKKPLDWGKLNVYVAMKEHIYIFIIYFFLETGSVIFSTVPKKPNNLFQETLQIQHNKCKDKAYEDWVGNYKIRFKFF